jgi:hypothetical protein
MAAVRRGRCTERAAAFVRFTSTGRLARVWGLIYGLVARAIAAYLRYGNRDATVYVRGSVATGQPVFGLSDLDMEVVADSIAGTARIRARVDRLQRRVWVARKLLSVATYDRATFGRAMTSLSRPAQATYFGLSHDFHGTPIETRPELSGPARSWKRISGEERRVDAEEITLQQRRVAAWLELQHWWRYALNACIEPVSIQTPYLCMKLVAEPARVWMLLEHGELIIKRRDALQRALSLLPEEEPAIRNALRILGSLHRAPSSSIDAVLPWLVRISSRVADRIGRDLEPAGRTAVVLWPGRPDRLATDLDLTSDLLPLCDWRARCFRPRPDETFVVADGSPVDSTHLVTAAARSRPGAHVVLRGPNFLVLPMTGVLRAIQCEATDPVTFALCDGRLTAQFPNVQTWSADHSARREVAEHRNWLMARPRVCSPAHAVAVLLGASRAAYFLQTLREGRPILALTCDAAAQALATLAPDAHDAAFAAAESYIEYRRGAAQPSQQLVTQLEAAVTKLPCY